MRPAAPRLPPGEPTWSRHIAKVSDIDALPDGTPFMVLELLHGNNLDREIEARGTLPQGEPIPCSCASASALQACSR